MGTVKAQLVADVRDAVEAGDITDFMDYHKLLLPYDDHSPLVDSLPTSTTYVYDESGAHTMIDNDGERPAEDEIQGECIQFRGEEGIWEPEQHAALAASSAGVPEAHGLQQVHQ